MARWHAVLVHPELTFSSGTERLLATARALIEQGARVTIAARSGSREGAAREAGAEIAHVELPTDPRRSPFAAARTRRRLRRLEPDIVHATVEGLAPLLAWIAPGVGVPYLLELHGVVARRVPLHLELFRGALVPSEPQREAAVNHGQVPRALVRVVPHAPAPVPREGPGSFERERQVLVGCSGFLDDAFDAEWLLDAARLLTLRGVKAHFAVLGEGPNELRLRRRIRKGGLCEHVTIAVPTTSAVGDTLADLDVHVSCRVPGPGWLAPAAMVQGVPSVLAAVGEAFQLVEDHVSGVLVEPGDPVRLADELQSLLNNRECARTLGARGRERILAEHPTSRFAQTVAEIHAVALGTAVVQ